MSGTLLALPVAVPLLAAALLIAVPGRQRLHLAVGVLVNAGVLALGGALVAATSNGTVLTQRVGGWPPGFAITLAADAFSAVMVSVSATLVIASLAFAARTGQSSQLFTPLTLILSAGVYGAYLTADLFNLFVFVEVMLAPSYALLTGIGGRRITASRIYVTTSLLASTFLLAGVALVYSVTGTVNLGALAGSARHSATAALAGAVVLLALAAKSAVVPLHGWLPRTYPEAPPAVMVLFSGLLTKVGAYAIIRVYAVMFAGAPQYRWVIMAVAVLTMVIGVLGAVGQRAVREILAFHMVSQIGYILLGLALFSAAGLTAAIFFLVQYVLVKAALLVCAGAMQIGYGSDRLGQLGGFARRDPLFAATFLVAAFSLAGLPPLSGFIAKLALIQAAVAGGSYPAAAFAIAVSFFTLLSMLKIWSGVFAGKEAAATARPAGRAHAHGALRPALIAPGLALAVPSIVFGIWAQPLFNAAAASATGLLHTAAYVRAVTR